MLTIYTAPRFLPEKEYAFHVVLREMLGVEYQVIPTPSEPHSRLSLPNGAELIVENHLWPPDRTMAPQLLPHPFQPGDGIVSLFGQARFTVEDKRIDCGADLFGAAFYMLTRLEETLNPNPDRHGRFPAMESLAFKSGFLHRPVVNEWADLLWQMLQKLGWKPPRPKRQYKLAFSCDVDHPRLWWSATDRFKTLGGALLKRGNFREAFYFTRKHLLNTRDPYDVFDDWLQTLDQLGHQAQFNFLGARPRTSDCWYPLEHPFVKSLMDKIARHGHDIGFHPSYEAFESQAVFDRELASLRAVSPVEITRGRQHYLRFAAPGTWRMWQEAGLACDSTLGFPEAEGFRCGICHDFPVFDVEKREMLPLRELPLIAMDVTLAQYRGYTPEQGAGHLDQLRREVKKHQGDFTLLWHNSSWNTPFWEPWKRVFSDFMAG